MLKPSILWVVLAVALLAGCANTPQTRAASASDCGFHFTGGSGTLGLLGAMGAFDRPAGAACRRPAFPSRRWRLAMAARFSVPLWSRCS